MPAQEDYQRFSELADELEMDDENKEKWVNQAMKRKGYKPVTSWTDPEPENNGGGGDEDLFGPRRKKEGAEGGDGSTPPPGGKPPKSGSGWQYAE